MPNRRRPWLWIAGLVLLAALAGGLTARWFGPPDPAAPPPPVASTPNPPVAEASVPVPSAATVPASSEPAGLPNIEQRTASVATIEAHRGTTPVLFRLDVDPLVLVLDFPTLHQQALMLNRVAALIEKADTPHDHVMAETELDAHIRSHRDTPDTYYYGHDYRTADLARFFRLAATQGMPLNPWETWLRDRLWQEGWLQADAVGALISIPGVSERVDAATRTAILRHELSHAVYFTDVAYVALTRRWWTERLTANERAAFRTFLGQEGYDTADEDLMANEGQAYFVHTRDPRYFTPAMIGMTPAREAVLRGSFIEAIPETWLRDSALAVAPAIPAAEAPDTAALALPARPIHGGEARR